VTYKAVTTGLNFIAKGFTDLALSMLSGGKSAREYAAAMKLQRDEYAAAIAQFKHDDLAAALAQNVAAADQLRKQLQDSLGDAVDMIRALANGTLKNPAQGQAAIDAAEAKNAAMIARQVVYAQEDLTVRNMRALGQTSQADLLAFQEEQARVMQAAIDANKDQTYLQHSGDDPEQRTPGLSERPPLDRDAERPYGILWDSVLRGAVHHTPSANRRGATTGRAGQLARWAYAGPWINHDCPSSGREGLSQDGRIGLGSGSRCNGRGRVVTR